MKPIQQHKDSRITNISFDNFTGSICIITPISEDEETKGSMLSPPQTNGGGGGDFFNPNQHITLITQPILGARSRKNSVTNRRRSSFNDSPALILSNNQVEKSQYESFDSGLDLSLSTNSSVQYSQQQQHITIQRPLSALNEDSSTDDNFHDQSVRFPIVNKGRNRSLENIIDNTTRDQQHRSSSFSDEQEKMIKKCNDVNHFNTRTELHQQANMNRNDYLRSHIPQYRSLNDLTNQTLPTTHTIIRKPNASTLKPLRKKSKLNIIVESSMPLSYPNVNDEQIHSTRTTSSSSNQTISHLIQKIKPKSITPLDHYPNQEQIRAHINRSVIERQHPSYLSIPTRKGVIQQPVPFDASPSKVNNLLLKQQKQPATICHSNASTIAPSRQSKQTLPILYNEEPLDHRREKRNTKEKNRLNEIYQYPDNSQKEQVRTKMTDIQQPFRSNQNYENFLTSTPRHHYEQQITKNIYPNPTDKLFKHNQLNNTILKKKNINDINRRKQSIDPIHESKPIGLMIRNKNRTLNSNKDLESSLQSHSTKATHIPNIQYQTEQKSPIISINTLFQTTRVQREINRFTNASKIDSTQFDNIRKNSNRFFPTRSPTSWSLISDHQVDQSSSSPRNDKLTHSYQLIIPDEQQPLDGRYVIPSTNSRLPLVIDSPSQTSSHHTYPFTCTPDSNNNLVDNSSYELIAPNNSEYNLMRENSSSSSSLDQFSPHDRFPLPLGKVTISMNQDDISTNYDSDDGWSDDSAELLYVDERYMTQKKKKNTSSSHFISQQHSHLQT